MGILPLKVAEPDVVELILIPGSRRGVGQDQMDVGVLPLPYPVDEGDFPSEMVRIAAEDQMAVEEDVQELRSVFGGGFALS